MCGLCGIYSQDSLDISKDIIQRMNDALRHRGPDDDGYFYNNNIHLGNRRLSIIDINKGKQPIFNENRTIAVVYNGEIYNFKDLRANLENKGHIFATSCDTEVIIHAYEEYGIDCVQKFNGMFAFALWDQNIKTLILARDRVGIKPLYYTAQENKVIFASELKAILKYPFAKKEIDINSLNEYLSFEYVPAPKTILKNIHKLPPGHLLLVKNGSSKCIQYWNPLEIKKINPKELKDEEQILARLREEIEQSVQRRLVSDVPLGVFLSGGIDSSTLAYYACKLTNNSAKTFSIGFTDNSFDESKYSKLMAKKLNSEHRQMLFKRDDISRLLTEVTSFLDEPFGDASIISTYFLSKFSREKITVALGGDGGDELFAGYPHYFAHKLAHYYEKLPQPLRKHFIEKMVKLIPVSTDNISFDFKLKTFISGIGHPLLIKNQIWLGSFRPDQKQLIFNDKIRGQLTDLEEYNCLETFDRKIKNSDLIDKVLSSDFNFYLQEDILMKVDRASMANSLEVRVPFLDHNLIEFVMSLPSNYKLRGITPKYILKKALKDLLPHSILFRGKKGFGIPVAEWIKNEGKDFIHDVFHKDKIRREEFFDETYIQTILDDHFQNKKDNRKLIWTLLIFELWMAKYYN